MVKGCGEKAAAAAREADAANNARNGSPPTRSDAVSDGATESPKTAIKGS